MKPELPKDLSEQVTAALREDVGSGDVTAALVRASQTTHGRVIAREAGVICGAPWVDETFRQLDSAIRLHWKVRDGERVASNAVVFEIAGPAPRHRNAPHPGQPGGERRADHERGQAPGRRNSRGRVMQKASPRDDYSAGALAPQDPLRFARALIKLLIKV